MIPYVNRSAPFPLDPAIALLGNEPEGMALDFLNMRAYVRDRGTPANFFLGDPNSLLTYSSPSAKYIVNSAGLLVPGTTLRCDHDPATLEPLGLLVESAATNLASNSETASATAKISVNSNTATGPDGASTADELVDDGTSGEHYSDVTISVTSGTTYSFSRWVKATASPRRVFLRTATFGTAQTGVFDPATGTFAGAGGGAAYVTQGVKAYPNGWYRIYLVMTASGTGSLVVRIQLHNGSSSVYTGDSVSGVYVFGLQFETGTWPSSYIKTTGSSATRAADNITLATSAFPFNKAASSVVSIYSPIGDTALNYNSWSMDLDTGSSAEAIYAYRQVFTMRESNSGVIFLNHNASGISSGNELRHAVAWADGDQASLFTGGNKTNDLLTASAALDTDDLTTVHFGKAQYGLQSNVHIKRFVCVPRRVSNAELMELAA